MVDMVREHTYLDEWDFQVETHFSELPDLRKINLY